MRSYEESIPASGLIREEHFDDFLRDLKNPDYRWLLRDPSDEHPRLQGDILEELPAAMIAEDGDAKKRIGKAMVINNVCDLQPNRSDSINIALVFDFKTYAASIFEHEPERARNHLEDITLNRIDEFVYIPNCNQIPDGAIVRLDSICTIPPNIYEEAVASGARCATLTQSGYYYFLTKLAHFFLRQETAEVKR